MVVHALLKIPTVEFHPSYLTIQGTQNNIAQSDHENQKEKNVRENDW